MIKTIIIDDEPKIIKNIKNILYVYCKNVSVVAEAENVKSGVEAIKTHDPDLVLLDINMPDGSGFDLLEKIPQRNFLTIFITAYDEYAVKAIKYSAADYILKPIDKNELISAIDKIEKIKKGKNAKFINAKYELLFENLRSPSPKKITFTTVDGLEILNIDDIIHIKAEGSYCRVFLKNCQEMTLARPLKELDELLQDNESFYRTHKSHLINLEHVKRVSRINKMIEMTDGSKVEIAGEKKEEVIEAIKRYNSLK